MSERRIEMTVESVRVHAMSTTHVVILKERAAERYLPIWIGPWEANAIAMRLQGVDAERPMTHDLLVNVIGALHARIREIAITDLAEETYHARVVLEAADERILEIDARPSDAIALAVRVGAPIYADVSVLERAGVRPDAGGGTDEDDEAGSEPDDEKLSVFREFINSLDFGSGGGGDESREGPRRPDSPPPDQG
jgi:bifunctional DNase/RNase